MRWEILNTKKQKDTDGIIDALLKNRGIKDGKEFFSPPDPIKISLKSLEIKPQEVEKAVKRIQKAHKSGEQVFVYGDYDADGICATAVLWESLHSYGLNVLPYIPDRFEEGYGINPESITKLKEKYPGLKLIVTVDNGIVAYAGVDKAKKLGIDVIVLDHHQKGTKKLNSLATVHTTKLSGSGIAWIFSRELLKDKNLNTLELAAIGTIADQLPLTGPNRSIVKFGLEDLNVTRRPGLRALFEEAGLTAGGMLIKPLSTYEVGFIIAPRINAMGRLKHGIESLRLLCTKDRKKAEELAKQVASTNLDRQKIVEEVVIATRKGVIDQKIIVVSGENYHEGVIGLAAGRLVEEFYRPAIVMSVKGSITKASARSVSGFNIIEAIRSLEGLYLEGGGHPMAAGFSIQTENIEKFTEAINEYAKDLLTGELLDRKLKVDLEIGFDKINYDLVNKLKEFEPVGLGNPTPTFAAKGAELVEAKTVGREAKHLKLKVKQDGQVFDSIYFGGGEMYSKLASGSKMDFVFQVEENVWNSHTSLQLKIKDLNVI
jgi:single-stranded-DNA-specific exonuclease